MKKLPLLAAAIAAAFLIVQMSAQGQLKPFPIIIIEKLTNGVDADDANGGDAPLLTPGDPVEWTYVVTNFGNIGLTDIVVTDDQGHAVTCPETTLAVGESMVCTASALAEDLASTSFMTVQGLCEGEQRLLYENIGMVVADFVGNPDPADLLSDMDPSHYCNPRPPSPLPLLDSWGLLGLGVLLAVLGMVRTRRWRRGP